MNKTGRPAIALQIETQSPMPCGAAMGAKCCLWNFERASLAHPGVRVCLDIKTGAHCSGEFCKQENANTRAAFAPAIWDDKDSWIFFRFSGYKSVVCWHKKTLARKAVGCTSNTSWGRGVTNSSQNHISHIRNLCRAELPKSPSRKPSPGAHDRSTGRGVEHLFP